MNKDPRGQPIEQRHVNPVKRQDKAEIRGGNVGEFTYISVRGCQGPCGLKAASGR
jgi:hypothetical protein